MSHHPQIVLCVALFPVDAHRRRPYVRRLVDNVAQLAVLRYVSFNKIDVLFGYVLVRVVFGII